VVGNIACASWGPPNQLAYVERFGLFDADVVVLVLNSGDVNDVPGLEPVGAAWPTHAPLLAIQEPLRIWFERYAPGAAVALGTMIPAKKTTDDPEGTVAAALGEIVAKARAVGGARTSAPLVGAVLYANRSEIAATSVPGLDKLQKRLRELNVPVWSAAKAPDHPGFTDDPALFLADGVHPSAAGQVCLAEILRLAVLGLEPPTAESKPQGGRPPARPL
jgi:hypothetical protein